MTKTNRLQFSLDNFIEQVHLEHIVRIDALVRDAFVKHFGFPITDVKDTENLRRVVTEGSRIEQFQYREETFFIWKPGTEYSVDKKDDCFSITLTTQCAQV